VTDPANGNSISISVVVPVRDEEDSIAGLIDALLNQTLPPNEIVITDGGSVDQSPAIVGRFIERGAPIRLVRDPDSLPGRSRNLGVANAKNSWIAFIDAGIKPAPNWLEELAQPVRKDANIDVVYGTYEPNIDSFFTECAVLTYVPPPVESEAGMVRPPSIASTLMRRNIWEKTGGFPEQLRSAEDLLFMRRIIQSGAKIVRTPKAIVYWNIQPNFRGTFKRFSAYARNNIRAGLFAEWQGRIFIYYAILAVSVVLALFFGWRSLVIPPALWLLFLVSRAVRALNRNRKKYPASPLRNLARLFVMVPILMVLDVATFVGSIHWLLTDKMQLRAERLNGSG
jgi:glycosyltransferase involved in cell wall biosynthesis